MDHRDRRNSAFWEKSPILSLDASSMSINGKCPKLEHCIVSGHSCNSNRFKIQLQILRIKGGTRLNRDTNALRANGHKYLKGIRKGNNCSDGTVHMFNVNRRLNGF